MTLSLVSWEHHVTSHPSRCGCWRRALHEILPQTLHLTSSRHVDWPKTSAPFQLHPNVKGSRELNISDNSYGRIVFGFTVLIFLQIPPPLATEQAVNAEFITSERCNPRVIHPQVSGPPGAGVCADRPLTFTTRLDTRSPQSESAPLLSPVLSVLHLPPGSVIAHLISVVPRLFVPPVFASSSPSVGSGLLMYESPVLKSENRVFWASSSFCTCYISRNYFQCTCCTCQLLEVRIR